MKSGYGILSRVMIGIAGTTVPSNLANYAKLGLKSVVIYGENIAPDSSLSDLVRELRAILGHDAVIAIDEEGGDVTRVDYISGSRFAGNGWLGQHGDLELTERDGRLIGSLLLDLGINLNFAPVADVNSNPLNPVIGLRSFGADAVSVGSHVEAFVRGHEGVGVGATLKHFPGHGDVSVDSHVDLPKIVGGWEALEPDHLLPFRAGIRAGASAVMVGHLDLGNGIPATLDAMTIRRLREDFQFDGLIITDALDMGAVTAKHSIAEAAVAALLAGNDLACLGPHTSWETLDEIQRLWAELPIDFTQHNDTETFKRLERFQTSHRSQSSSKELTVEYDFDLNIPADFQDARIFRLESEGNPAVGVTPWFADLPVERSVSVAEVRDILTLGSRILLLNRSPKNLVELQQALSECDVSRLLVVSSVPATHPYSFQVLATYGAACPQTSAIAKSLTGRK